MLCFRSNPLKIFLLFVSFFFFISLTSGSPDLLHVIRTTGTHVWNAPFIFLFPILFLDENAVTFVFIEEMGCFNLVGCAAVEVAGEREHVGINGVVTWPLDTRRFLEENTTVLLLAQQRTSRRDPLNGFNRYTGGWNISNKHYWAVSYLILTLI